jgi:hypothetical protein
MASSDRLLLTAALRTDFYAFAERSFELLNPGKRFLPNWHLEAICHHMELARCGVIRRLIINVPPRSLKSTIGSAALPAFILGHDPARRVIVVTYASDLTIKFANDCRALVQSSFYKDLFPGTRLSRNKNTEAEFITTRYGYRLAASVGGSLTGRGGDFIIIDDPLKPQDALSDLKRESVNDWFDNTLLSRLDDKRTGVIVALMQRLHPDDLTGKLLRNSDDWVVLSFPAIAEQDERIKVGRGEHEYYERKVGDPLHPEREPLSVLENLRTQLGSEIFAAQYLQSPLAPGGNMIKRDWVRRWDPPLARTPSTYVLQSYDTALKSGENNDWSVCTTWHIIDGRYYLVDELRGRFDYPDLKTRAIEHAQAHRPTKILVEDSGLAIDLVPALRERGFAAVPVKVE